MSTNCCPKFDPSRFDEKTLNWNNKLFIKDKVRQLFHIPLNMGQVISRNWQLIQDNQAALPDKDFLILSYDPSPWLSELYFTVSKEIDGAQNVRLSGKFITKVFDGPYQAVPKFIKIMEDYAISQHSTINKHFFHYAYCPKCAKIYGHNYMVDFAFLKS